MYQLKHTTPHDASEQPISRLTYPLYELKSLNKQTDSDLRSQEKKKRKTSLLKILLQCGQKTGGAPWKPFNSKKNPNKTGAVYVPGPSVCSELAANDYSR